MIVYTYNERRIVTTVIGLKTAVTLFTKSQKLHKEIKPNRGVKTLVQ